MRVRAGRAVVVGVAATLVAGCDLGSAAVVHPAPGWLVEVVDVNGDGALDVVTAGPGAYQVLVNDGSGGLTGGPGVAVDGDVVAFAVDDLDGDGAVDRVDLVRSETGAGTLTLSSGDGSGGFGAPVVVASDVGRGAAGDVAVGDVDGDGDGDLLVAGTYGHQVFQNDGTGTFTRMATFAIPPCMEGPMQEGGPFVATEIVYGDSNGDGPGDLTMTGYCDVAAGRHAQVWQAFNDGSGSFQSMAGGGIAGVGTDVAPVGLSLVDIDADGYQDVVFGAPDASAVLIRRGAASGSLEINPIRVDIPAPPGDLEVADIDGDGHLDLVVTAAGSGFARVLYGTGTGAFPESHVVATGGDVVGPVAVGSLDGGGSVDLAFGNDGGTPDPSVAVLLNTLVGRQH